MNMCLVSFTTWVSKSFTTYALKSELISIAGIHATLVAIMVACLSAYILFAFGNLQTFQMRAIKEAERINEINFLSYHHGILKQGDDVWNKKKMVEKLYNIMAGHDDRSVTIEDRATKVLGIMNAIMSQYPFRNKFFKPDPKVGRFGSRGEAEPIIFGDFEEVRNWVKEIDDITGPLTSGWTAYSNNLNNLMVEFSKTERYISNAKTTTKAIATSPRLKNIFTPVSEDPLSSCHDFFSKLIESRKIMNETKYFIEQTDSYRGKVTSANLLFVTFGMIGLIFVFGVIFPLTQTSVSSLYLLYIPFIFYGMVYIFLLFKIIRIIWIK